MYSRRTCCRCVWLAISSQSRHSSDGADESLGDRVRLRRPDRRVDDPDSLGVEDRVEGTRELAVVVADQKLEWPVAFGEREHEVPALLGGPIAVGVLAHAREMHAPRRELDEEQHVDPLQHERVDREEIARAHALRLAADELTPRDPATLAGWSDPSAR